MTTSDQPNRFSVFRSWCWLLVCMSLLAAGQQLIGAVQRATTPSESLDVINSQPITTSRFVVDVNQAPVHELEALPNVGTALATRIVDYRQTQGPFRELDDLLQVHGVGERTLQQLRPMLTVRGANTESTSRSGRAVVDEATSP